MAKDGADLDSLSAPDVSKKRWNLSINGGVSFGADIVLGEKLGLNVEYSLSS